jgi:4'-phosphopantetheinyl transferase
MIEIYFVDTEKFDEKMFPRFFELLPDQQKDEVLSYRFFKTRVSVLFGKLLVLRYFSGGRTGGFLPDGFLIEKNKFGKPFVNGDVQFNISHSANITAAAFSKNETGLDIERVAAEKNYLDIARRFFHAEESDYIKNCASEAEAFFYIWTRKEALLKAVGSGLTATLSTYNCINNIIVDAETSVWYITSFNIKDGFKAAFCQNTPAGERHIKELSFDDFLPVHRSRG